MARKDGYWSGYHDYRYGTAKKPTLKRILTGEKKQHIVSRVMDLMKDWRMSPFENEGTIRHNLRSAFCEDGHGWEASDHQAELVVGETFRIMGAHRPSWEQGQRQYVIAQECCQWCAVEIPEEDRTGLRKARFCSAVCAKSAIIHRDIEGHRRESAVARSALSIIHREKLPDQKCEYCDRGFKPFSIETKGQRFCSVVCARLAERTIPETNCPTCSKTFRPKVMGRAFCSYECAMARPIEDRECLICHEVYTPKTEQALYCSKSCTMRSHRMKAARKSGTTYKPIGTLFDGTCRHCHQPYMARSPKAKYCGTRCRDAAHTVRKRQGNVIYLTAEIFDGWFKRAA